MHTIDPKPIHKQDPEALFLKAVLFLFFILPLVTCPLLGQVVQKKELTPDDYHLWGEMRISGVSSDGKWASYLIDYPNDADTLFVRSTVTQKMYPFTGSRAFEFISADRFVSLDDKSLTILNLKNGAQKNIDRVLEYAYSKTANALLVLIASEHQGQSLLVVNSRNDIIKKIDGVGYFSLSPSGKKALYSCKANNISSLGLLTLGSSLASEWIIEASTSDWHHFVWQQQGSAFAFLQQSGPDTPGLSLLYYNLQSKALLRLDPQTMANFSQDKIITDYYRYPVSIAPDGQKVFFSITEPKGQTPLEQSAVEQWNTNDKWVYPRQKYFGSPKDKPSLAVWFPFENRVTVITSPELSEVMLAGNDNYALLCSPMTNEPSFDDIAPRDFYLMDLATGNKVLLVQKVEDFERNILPSPGGKYIAYFHDKNWWIYDLSHKTHKNATQKIGVSFQGDLYSQNTPSAYGNPGWSRDDQELILYDQYDIWAIKPTGDFRKLTSGQEQKIQFRIAYLFGHPLHQSTYDGFKSCAFNLDQNLILRAEGPDGKTGYFRWTGRDKEKVLVYSDLFIDQLHYNTKEQSFIYQQQDFDQSPSLVFQRVSQKPQRFFQSNPQQTRYYWGRSELMEYQRAKGQNLQGILYYPAQYDPGKKYPMIVHIYEKQSPKVHLYKNPTLMEQDGFNPTVLTSRGYFVLCPDIVYETDKTGQSALDCVLAATASVIDRGIVDPGSIALMGHSFGGYESAFIATHTDMFATVIIGAAVTDLTSFYFTVGWNTGKPDMHRFKDGQYRITPSPIEDPLAYARNSPIASVSNLKTPVLLWSGKNDLQVDWHQSIEFYLAMHRLRKKNIMLLYPGEGHALLKTNNQKDLSVRIQQWFDHFLKKQQPEPWISEGTK